MQTIGERLEEARKKKGVSIREAAEATKIRGDYLQKFESNQFDIGLTEIYTRGFLRTYATYLKVPAERIMSDYAALGRGDVRPRQPNREVYGRMDITVASTAEAADRSGTPAEVPAAEGTQAPRQQPRFPRGASSSLPSGPDPAVLFKWAKIGGAVVGVILIVWLISMFFTRERPASSRTPAVATQPATATAPSVSARMPATVTLIAKNFVQITVQRKNADQSYGEKIFEGPLNAGESRTIAWPGALYITATACENVLIEVNGRRVGMGLTGYGVGELPAPRQ